MRRNILNGEIVSKNIKINNSFKSQIYQDVENWINRKNTTDVNAQIDFNISFIRSDDKRKTMCTISLFDHYGINWYSSTTEKSAKLSFRNSMIKLKRNQNSFNQSFYNGTERSNNLFNQAKFN